MEPQQYRILGPEETIQEGDEYQCKLDTTWLPVCPEYFGRVIRPASGIYKFRRPIPVAKSATVPKPWCAIATLHAGKNLESGGQCCCVHCERECDCDSPVKESLTTDPDESSDNSRSFQEISELNQKCSKLFEKAYELQEQLAEMKLRVEKAERERDEARAKVDSLSGVLCNINDTTRSRGFTKGRCDERVIALAQERDTLRAELEEAQETYDNLVRLLRKRFPQREDGSLPDFAVEDVLKENTRFREALEKIAKETEIMSDYEDFTHAAKIAQAALSGKGEK